MPQPTARKIRLLACLLLLTSIGCAPMFNAGIKDLALEPASQKQYKRPTRRNLDEFKIDPLRLQDISTKAATPLAEEPRTTEAETAKRQPVAELAALPPTKINKPIRLEPIVDVPEKQLTKASSQPVNNSDTAASDRAQAEPCQHGSDSTPIVLTAHSTSGGDFVAKTTATASVTKALPVETESAGNSRNGFSAPGVLLPERGSTLSISEPVNFFSSQMENLVPPFANHPDDVPFEDGVGFDMPSHAPTGSDNGQVDAATVAIPPTDESNCQSDGCTALAAEADSVADDNSFEQVIASSMDPNTDNSVSALAEMSSDPSDSVSARHAAYSESRLTWQNQLRRTIEVFEDEIDSSSDSSDIDRLKTGLTILQALETDISSQAVNSDGSENKLKEYWSHQIQAINELLKQTAADNGSSQSASRALEHLQVAVHELAAVAELKLAFTAFCTKVVGFGQYSPFENAEFESDQSVLVYCEIENFAPLLETQNGNTNYQTQLSSSFWITDNAGSIVQQQDFPAVTDNARNLRRDFFMHLPVTFGKLPSGKYELHIKVRDLGSGKIATLDQAMEFCVR